MKSVIVPPRDPGESGAVCGCGGPRVPASTASTASTATSILALGPSHIPYKRTIRDYLLTNLTAL